MKIIDFVTYLFYRYYNKGSTAIIAYESALLAVSMIIFMNVLALLLFFGIDTQTVLPIINDKGRVIKLLSGFLLFLPQYLILRLIIPQKRITSLNYSSKAIKYGKIGMILYILFSMTLIVIAVKTK